MMEAGRINREPASTRMRTVTGQSTKDGTRVHMRGNLTTSADEFGPRVERPAWNVAQDARDLGRFHGSQKFPGFQKNFKIVENGGRGDGMRAESWRSLATQMRSTGRNSGMSYDEVLVLIPSHSLEDFPSELSESDAESILNAFSIAWDPRLLLAAGSLPKWHRADDPPHTERDGSCSSRRIARAGSPEGVRAGDLGRRARGSRIVGTRSDAQGGAAGLDGGVVVEGGSNPEDPALEDRAAGFHSLGFHYLRWNC